jgi:hypothetical protein
MICILVDPVHGGTELDRQKSSLFVMHNSGSCRSAKVVCSGGWTISLDANGESHEAISATELAVYETEKAIVSGAKIERIGLPVGKTGSPR